MTRQFRRAPARAVALAIGILGAGMVRADEGRIPIAAPIVVSQPGYYIVTHDFCFGVPATAPCFAAGSGILVQSSDVTIDLNGHTLTNAGGAMAVRFTSAAVKGLVVKNGRLVGNPASGPAEDGIHTEVSTAVRIRIEGVEVREFTGSCVQINAADLVEMERSVLQSCTGGLIVGGTGTFRARIVDNLVADMGGNGMFLQGLTGGVVLRNVIRGFGAVLSASAGIYINGVSSAPLEAGGSLIQENTISSGLGAASLARGLWIDSSTGADPHNAVIANVIRENTGTGITLISDDARVERNVVAKNGSQGIIIGSGSAGARNLIDGNQIDANGACGLAFNNTLSHVYRNNMIRGNPAGSDVCGFGSPSTNAGGNVCTATCP